MIALCAFFGLPVVVFVLIFLTWDRNHVWDRNR